MDDHCFDALTRRFGAGHSRRRLLSGLLGGALGLAAAREAEAACRQTGRLCREHANCCTGYCSPPDATGRRRCRCQSDDDCIAPDDLCCDGACRPVASDPTNCGCGGERCPVNETCGAGRCHCSDRVSAAPFTCCPSSNSEACGDTPNPDVWAPILADSCLHHLAYGCPTGYTHCAGSSCGVCCPDGTTCDSAGFCRQ